jgi:predicted acetyltransferase
MSTRPITPDAAALPAYVAALEQGWSPDNVRGKAAADDQLAAIAADAAGFLAALDDPEARGGPIPQPDGTFTERLPGFHRWIWDDGFCGSISLRWRPGTEDLPPTCLGHVGYAVVPWKQGRGHATAALAMILPDARAQGLRWIDLTTDPANLPSQKVITANGGVLLERFIKPAIFGGAEGLRFRIPLQAGG